MSEKKQEIITFKVDGALWEALRSIPNRSEFIRGAILTALEGACPLCQGAGTISVAQRKHWESFTKTHAIEECDDCHAIHLVCSEQRKGARGKKTARRRQ
ncbi:MAG TPA: CopG family transcriptional regulator [Candidatus Hydrogenedentes bacterium]|nr:CopG family transcriptional regulator [Candidatus Hydrogenedentota bacterium]HNT88544.1 CopG family transcriptional regulator [Candidatus Hydrogenedentota bacterium]